MNKNDNAQYWPEWPKYIPNIKTLSYDNATKT